MSNKLTRGLTHLHTRRHAVMTESVLYRRGVYSVSLLATAGNPRFETTDDQNFVLATDGPDFTFRASDLVLNGSLVEPAAGDQIDHGDKTFEVMELPGIPVAEYTDSMRVDVRVHTKRVT